MVFKALLKQALLVALVFYGLPVFWWTYNEMDSDDLSHEDYLTVKFLMSTGLLLVSMSWGYLLLPIDLAFDWISVVGTLDDLLAKMAFGAGLMMCYLGYQFGSGPVPHEFEICVRTVVWMYGVIVPFVREKILPVIGPALQAIAVPMKVAAKAVLQMVLDRGRDPSTLEKVVKLTEEATVYGAAGEL